MLPIRPDDLFFGGALGDDQTDWVDTTRIAIPQADEQQRLLVNLIEDMAADRGPIPRFWFLPRGEKAAVVMTGDDHALGGTAGRFDRYLALSPAGCSVVEWECVRATSYIYPVSPLTAAQSTAYSAQGFEVGRPHLEQLPELDAVLARVRLRGAAEGLRRALPGHAGSGLEPHALRRLERLGDAAEGRARGRNPAGHELLPLPRLLDRLQARLHDRLGHADALRRPRRDADRRLPGGHADDRRVRPGVPVHRGRAPRQGARARGLLRDLHGQHAHRPRRARGLRGDRRLGPGPLGAGHLRQAAPDVARRPRGLGLPRQSPGTPGR